MERSGRACPGAGDFDPHALEQRYREASVMIGVLPIGRLAEDEGEQAAFFWSLKTDDHPAWLRAGAAKLERPGARVVARDGACCSIRSTTRRSLRSPPMAITPCLCPLASGSSSSATARIRRARSSGRGRIWRFSMWPRWRRPSRITGDLAAALAGYARLRRLHVRLYQALSVVFTPFYQSDSLILPLIRDQLVSPAQPHAGGHQAPGRDRCRASR